MATIADSTSSALSSSILSSLGTLSGTTSNVGANLNVSSLVKQLVAAERAPDQARLTTEQTNANAEISALAFVCSVVRRAWSGARSAATSCFTSELTLRFAPTLLVVPDNVPRDDRMLEDS